MSLVDHTLRVQIRIDIGNDSRAIREGTDLSLPATSTLAECLPEILTLAHAPAIHVPWQPKNIVGICIDPYAPLHASGLEQGATIVLAPVREEPTAIFKDTAESLSSLSRTRTLPGTTTASFIAALTAILVLALAFPLPHQISTSWKILGVGLCGMLLLAWPGTAALVPYSSILLALSAAGIVLGPGNIDLLPNIEPLQGALSIACGCLAALALSIIYIAVNQRIMSQAVIVFTSASIILLSCLGPLISQPRITKNNAGAWWPGLFAFALIIALLLVIFAPQITTKIAGCRPPILSNGSDELVEEQLDREDQRLITTHARSAILLLQAIYIGIGITATAALLGMSSRVGLSAQLQPYVQSLVIITGIALCFHAHRFTDPLITWSLWIPTLTAAIAGIVLINPDSYFSLGAGVITCIFLVSASVWWQHIAHLEPTTIVWLERFESLALAICLPIALHIAGLFTLIRGIGV